MGITSGSRREGGLALEEIGEIEATAENAVLVDVENGVASEAGAGRDVAAIEDGDEEGGAAEGGAGDA